MNVSVIIPTYNEKDVISDCLLSLDKQTNKNFEAIVVDDGSYDGTLDLVTQLKFVNYKLKFLQQAHKGTGAARNLGAKHARGKILVFLDADMTFHKKFLAKLTAPIANGKAKGTFSRDEYVSNWDSALARCWNINEGWLAKKRHPKGYPDKQPVFRAILAKEFNRVGGFSPGGYDDDWSLNKKLGYMAESVKNAYFYHKNPSTLSEIFSQAKWVGKRSYKFGIIGKLISLVRASIPLSILIGLYKSAIKKEPSFLVFKIVYDLGIFVGIITSSASGKLSK